MFVSCDRSHFALKVEEVPLLSCWSFWGGQTVKPFYGSLLMKHVISLTYINDLSGAFPECPNHANRVTVSCRRAQSDARCRTSSLTADILAKLV